MMLTFHVSASGSTVARSVGHRFVGIWCFCVAGMETPVPHASWRTDSHARAPNWNRSSASKWSRSQRVPGRELPIRFRFMIISQAVHTGLKPEVPRLVPKCAMSGRKSVTPQFASILADLEIEAVDIHVRRGPGKICATRTTERLLIDHDTGHLGRRWIGVSRDLRCDRPSKSSPACESEQAGRSAPASHRHDAVPEIAQRVAA